MQCARQLTGIQADRLMLDRAGLRHVGIGRSHGLLSDRYNPATRRLALSKDVHDASSIAAIGVAYARGWPCHPACSPLRRALAAEHPRAHGQHRLVNRLRRDDDRAVHGVAVDRWASARSCIAAVVLFQVVTLPVEFDATARAKKLVVAYGIISEREREGMDRAC